MYTVLGDRSYQVSIEKVEDQTIGSRKQVVLTGWAVDKLRHKALELAVPTAAAGISRQVRADIVSVFDLEEREAAGFTVTIPAQIRSFQLSCVTPGRTIDKRVDVARVRQGLRNEYMHKRMRQASFYLTHAWTPQGMRALLGAVKRRVVKRQGFYESWM